MAPLEIDIVGGRAAQTLSSEWHGLSPHLTAKFYEVYRDTSGEWLADENTIVQAPLTESSLDVTLNWQSPFENTGPESAAPAMMAMLQSGEIQQLLDSGEGVANAAGLGSLTGGPLNKLRSGASSLEGRAGITRLNSTQIFSGMPPVKIRVTALFRAWKDAAKEVEAPFNQLMSWALPQKLSEAGPLLSRAADYAVTGNGGAADVLAPSVVPAKIAMTYKGKTYKPLVIESLEQPISSPIDSSGKFVELLVPMTLCTLTALDRADWQKIGPL